VTPSGIVTVPERLLQYWNVPLPIVVTVGGITTEVKLFIWNEVFPSVVTRTPPIFGGMSRDTDKSEYPIIVPIPSNMKSVAGLNEYVARPYHGFVKPVAPE
jgi:hypothetical protein